MILTLGSAENGDGNIFKWAKKGAKNLSRVGRYEQASDV